MSTYGASWNTVKILHHYMVVKIFRILGKAQFCEICHIHKDIYGLRALKNKTKGTRSIKRKTVGSIGIRVWSRDSEARLPSKESQEFYLPV